MGMLNSAAVKNESPWESAMPSARPIASDTMPTKSVSINTI